MSATDKKKKQNSDADERERRREAVAALRLRGATVREIREQLKKLDFDVSPATVGRDLQALRGQWKESSLAAIDDVVSRELAKLDQLERDAWKEKQYGVVLSIMSRRAQLLGLDEQPAGAALFDLDEWKAKREGRRAAYGIDSDEAELGDEETEDDDSE